MSELIDWTMVSSTVVGVFIVFIIIVALGLIKDLLPDDEDEDEDKD